MSAGCGDALVAGAPEGVELALESVKHGFIHFHNPAAVVARGRKAGIARSKSLPAMPDRIADDDRVEEEELSSSCGEYSEALCAEFVALASEGFDGAATPHMDFIPRTPSTTCPSPNFSAASPASPCAKPMSACPDGLRTTSVADAGNGPFDVAAKDSAAERKPRRERPVPFKSLMLPEWAMELAAKAPVETDFGECSSWYSASPPASPLASPRPSTLPSPCCSPEPVWAMPVLAHSPAEQQQLPTMELRVVEPLPAKAPASKDCARNNNKVRWADFAEADDLCLRRVRWADAAEGQDSCPRKVRWADLAEAEDSCARKVRWADVVENQDDELSDVWPAIADDLDCDKADTESTMSSDDRPRLWVQDFGSTDSASDDGCAARRDLGSETGGDWSYDCLRPAQTAMMRSRMAVAAVRACGHAEEFLGSDFLDGFCVSTPETPRRGPRGLYVL